VKPVDNFLNSTIGQYVGSAFVGGLLAGATILAAPEETAIGGTLVLGDVLVAMGRSVLGKTIGDFLDGTIGTVKTDSGTINPTKLPKAGGEINAENGDVENLSNMSPNEIAELSKGEIQENLPQGWKYYDNNGFTQVKDEDGVTRIRIDPPSKNGNPDYPHMHIYNQNGEPLDMDGIVVDRKSPDAHIPYDK
jgi:hypothetical protein